MENQATVTLCLRIIFGGLFFITLIAGFWILKNHQRLFGVDPTIPSETSGARLYSKVLIVVIWLHALAITGGFALLID